MYRQCTIRMDSFCVSVIVFSHEKVVMPVLYMGTRTKKRRKIQSSDEVCFLVGVVGSRTMIMMM
jgi:hypothetical protein